MNGYILFFSRSFLVLVLIGLLVPLYPLMPTAGLDPSWSFAMSYALKTDLTIGKDLIFTFGPYVYLYTKIYMPNTDWPSLILGGYLVFSYFFR